MLNKLKLSDTVIRKKCLFFGIAIFFFSLFLSSFYVGGDQIGYSSAYLAMKGMNFIDAWDQYHKYLTNQEPIHFFISFSGGMIDANKNLLFSLLNGVLAFCTAKIYLNWGVSFWYLLVILLTNFYFLGLYFSAERLKLSVLFFELSYLSSAKPLKRILFAILSLGAHFSIIFPIVSGCSLLIKRYRLAFTFRNVFFGLLLIVIFLCLLYFYWDTGYLDSKIDAYATNDINVITIFPTLLLFSYCIYKRKDFLIPCIFFIPLLVAIFFLGGSRLNFFSFFSAIFLLKNHQAFKDPLIFLLFTYLSIKGVKFIYDVITFGHAIF
ncbi:hypothetical protein G6682_01795 [Polynucleobacter paneuropaeus]|jgi:hypothetical protein|nr:hypothetical protein G6682_01795 [Polynucleobacter paneuropaeus]